MKRKLIIILSFILCSCTNDFRYDFSFEGEKIRVTTITDDIVRVQAVPSDAEFPEDASLCVLPLTPQASVRTVEEEGRYLIETASLRISFDKKDGTVSFMRLSDGVLLARENYRRFEPFEADGDRGYSVTQTFIPMEEGFFGLGQDQTDEWNWKGKNESLYQYNTKISVPFAVSSKKYGILWDGYSYTRWGDPRPYSQLGDVFTLYDASGNEGALTGRYVQSDGTVMERRETSLAQEYLRTPQCDVVVGAPEGFNFFGSKVTFDGELEPKEDGIHHFFLYYAGYTKVFVGGKQVIPEIWRTAWNPNGRKFEVDMKAGERVPLHIEWEPDGGVSYNALKVLSPRTVEEQQGMSWWGELQDQIDYYFVNGESIDEVISGYRTLTGKAPILPRWAMGYWQSRERYSTQDQVLATLAEFRRRHIPIDNIVQDWQYWKDDQWGSHEFDESRFPDPKGMVDSIHNQKARFMISVWPKFYVGTEHFNELQAGGWIYPTPVSEKVIDWLGHEQSFYDAYAPEARKLFWKQLNDHLYCLGVDAWWMDADEPNIHDCVDMDFWKKMCGPTALGSSTRYLNTYSLVNGMAFYEGQKSTAPDSRVFILSRNGFAGLQRYSTACWSGDIGTRWEEMKAQISAGLNFAMAGMPFWGQDIGGFSVENRFMRAQSIYDATGKVNEDLNEWRELNTRWHQWGIYTPLYRSHGQWPYREPWNIAPEGTPTYDAIVAADRARYGLMPYIYTLDARVHFEDYTMMRPLVMDFTDDPTALNISDEFMFGDAILVCPVYEYGARSRTVYLPAGSDWFDAATGEIRQGGTSFTADAPYDRIPVFYRSGQIIVRGPEIETTADSGDSSLTVEVYPGNDTFFSLYEDDGLTSAYEKGAFARIPMYWDELSGKLTLGACEGSYPEMIQERDITVKVAGLGASTVRYTGTEVTLTFK